MRVILPAKGDALALEGYEPMVGNSHPLGVAAEIPKHLPWPAESRLGIDHPILSMEAAQKFAERFLIGQRGGRSGATQLLTTVETLEAGDELAAEDSAEHLQGEKKPVVARMHPAAVIGPEATRRDDAVDMRMGEQIRAPGVENAENTDLRAHVLRIRRDFQEGSGAGREQEVIKLTRVVLRQEIEFVGDGEDHVKVGGGQQFLFPCGKPAFARLGLALGEVPITTRVVRDGLKSALGAGIEVTVAGAAAGA